MKVIFLQSLLALLVYPGFLFTLGLSILAAKLSGTQIITRSLGKSFRKAWRESEVSITLLTICLASGGLLLLPWPLHPTFLTARPPEANGSLWLGAWAGLEGAFLLALLPGLFAGSPLVARASSREAQLGVVGRSLLWLALGSSLVFHQDWRIVGSNGQSPLLAHILAILAAIVAFPAAIGWGPFRAKESLAFGGPNHGLDSQTIDLAQAAHALHRSALLAASLVALLPPFPQFPLVNLVLIMVVFSGLSFFLAHYKAFGPVFTLQEALRFCWWRALPCGIIALAYLGFVR